MIEEIQNNFKLAMKFRQNAVYCLETMLASKDFVSILNNTKEANTFNLIGICLYSKALIEIRKILEPVSAEKKANIRALIEYIRDNKNYLIEKHYIDALKTPIHLSNFPFEGVEEFIKLRQEKKAEQNKKRCKKQIDLILVVWDIFWKRLGNEYAFIKDNRDNIVHSFTKEVTKLPSIAKLYRVLNIATWFLKKIDYIINNSTFDYSFEKEQLSDISKTFWSRIK